MDQTAHKYIQNDIELLKDIKKDNTLFTIIYNKYFKYIYKYCYLRSNYDKEVTEDLVSDVFTKALLNIDKVNLSNDKQSTLLPWLYVITKNEIKQRYRKLDKKDETSLTSELIDFIPDHTQNDEKNTDIKYEADKILELMKDLNSVSQEIVYLKIYNELSFIEIAKQLNMKESAVKMQYYRAIEYVTKKLNNTLI